MLPVTCELSVVAPIYSGEQFVDELIERLHAALSSVTPDYEVILVDDGSADRVWERIVAAGSIDPRVKGVRLARNFGQHPAITAGLDHASGRWLVVMDSDLQDRPEDIPSIYREATSGNFDVVIARRATQRIKWTKRVPSIVFNKSLSWLGGIEASQSIGNFRVFSRKVADAFLLHREQFRFFPALMARLGFKVGYLDVARDGPPQGRSTYSVRKLVKLAVDAIVANSEKPLWFGIYGGALMALVAMSLAIWAVVRKALFDVGMSGWSSLFVAVAFFSGVQLMFAGLLGIYIGRIFNETKQRPIYIVSDMVNGAAAKQAS